MPDAEKSWWALNPKKKSSLSKIWKENINPEIYKQWNTTHKNLITKACVAYLLRIYTFADMCRTLKTVPGKLEDWRLLRLAIVQNYSTVLGLKLLLLRAKARELNGKPLRLRQEIKSSKLLMNDRAIFFSLKAMGLEQELIEVLYKLPGNNIPSVSKVIQDAQRCIEVNKQFVDKFVGRKHQFIYKGNRFEHHDIANDLKMLAVQAFYHVTPFLTDDHRDSTFKRVAHNQGIKLIEYYTDPVRARQRRDGDKFYNVIRVIKEGDTENEEEIKIGKSEVTSHNRVVLRDYCRNNPNNLQILQLLMQKDDNEFVEFAEREASCIFSSTEDIYNVLGCEKYYELIAKFLRIKLRRVLRVVCELQSTLINPAEGE